ncbi:MAG: hypothetical protein JWO47_909 [Candidatus Saccharibacteria bacterium]|nr:hypothetical protein [Candidatus Saccharibacteria bacterium]
MKKLQSKKLVAALIVIVLILVGSLTMLIRHNNHENYLKKQAQTKAAQVLAKQQKEHITYKGVTGKTALEILKAQHTVTTKTYSFGEQVTSIDGLAGNGPKYWTFYINGKMADVGAGTYQTAASDNIEWKWEQL